MIVPLLAQVLRVVWTESIVIEPFATRLQQITKSTKNPLGKEDVQNFKFRYFIIRFQENNYNIHHLFSDIQYFEESDN